MKKATASRAIAFLLATLLLAVMLAACTGGDGAATTTAVTTKADATTAGSAAATTTAAAGKPSAYGEVAPEDQLDYINYDSAVPIVKEGQNVTLQFGVKLEPGFPNNVMENWFWEFLEDQLNITPQVSEILDQEKRNLLFASNQVPDFFLDVDFTPSEIVKYGISDKQLLPISDYMDGYIPSLKAYFESDPKAMINKIASDGKMYSVPRTLNPTTIVGSYIHTYWLEQLDIDVPTTLDEFNQAMLAIRDAGPAALGVDRVIPISGGYGEKDGWSNPAGVLTEALGFQINPYWKDWKIAAGYIPCQRVGEDGKAYYGLPVMDPLFAEMMAVQNMWYTENLLSPEYFTMDAAQVRADATAGFTGWANTGEGISAYDGPGGKGLTGWRMLAPLTSAYNSTPVSVNYNIYNTSPYYIGGNTKYPEVCARLMDLFFNPEWDYIMARGPIEGDERTPLYGYKGYTWGLDANGNEAIVVEGEKITGAEAYWNTHLRPTYMDHALFNTFQRTANWKSVVAGKTIEPDSKDAIIARNNANYETDPVKYSTVPYANAVYSTRGVWAENSVDPIMTAVYRDPATNQKIADLDAVLKPYIMEQAALFIAGKRPLSEIPAFQNELKAMGIDDYTAILQAEYQDYLAKVAQ